MATKNYTAEVAFELWSLSLFFVMFSGFKFADIVSIILNQQHNLG